MSIVKKFESSFKYHRDCPPFKLVEDERYHGGKKSIVRNGLAQSVSRVTIGGKVVFAR